MTIKLNKWGNSIALRLPSSVVKSLKLEVGHKVNLKVEEDTIIIKAAKSEMTLEWLCEGMDANDRHEEYFSDFEGDEKFWEDE